MGIAILSFFVLSVQAYGTTHTINPGDSFIVPEQSAGCGSTGLSHRSIATGPSHGTIQILGTTIASYPVSTFKGHFEDGFIVYFHDGGASTSDQFTVGDDCGNTLTVSITINQAGSTAPAITTNPTNTTVCIGYNASFTAAATGTPAPTVQWQVSTNSGATFSNIGGATNVTYSFSPSAADNNNQYQAVFTNTAGSATTSAATLTVSPPPTFSVTLNPQMFTSSGGNMRTVFATIGVSGGCSPAVSLQSITSSDPDAGTFPGDQASDVQNAVTGTDDRQFDLRAEITPPEDDRTYRVIYRVTDGTYTQDVTKPVIVPSGIGTLSPGGTNDCGIFLGALPEMTGATVNIPYTLSNPTTVRLTVYNTKGKAVYGLVNEIAQTSGPYTVSWNGTNNAGLNPGTQQPNGYYFVLIEGCADYRSVAVLFVNRP